MKSKLISAFAGAAAAMISVTAVSAAALSEDYPFGTIIPTEPPAPLSEYFEEGDHYLRRYPDDDFLTYFEYRGNDRLLVVPAESHGYPVTTIGKFCLANKTCIQDIVLPEGIKIIRESFAYKCYDFRQINFPKSLELIDEFAFSNCYYLESVRLNRDLKEIGQYAFQLCNTIKAMSIPGSVKTIPNNIFQNMSDLTTVRFMEGTEEISYEASLNNPRLRKVVIPPSVKNIGEHAFGYSLSIDGYARNGDVCIFGTPGTEAEKFAKANGLSFCEFDYAYGDVNGSGLVDAADATEVLSEYNRRSVGEKSGLTTAQLMKAELNDDNTVDASDASSILMYYTYSSSGGTDSPAEFFFLGV